MDSKERQRLQCSKEYALGVIVFPQKVWEKRQECFMFVLSACDEREAVF